MILTLGAEAAAFVRDEEHGSVVAHAASLFYAAPERRPLRVAGALHVEGRPAIERAARASSLGSGSPARLRAPSLRFASFGMTSHGPCGDVRPGLGRSIRGRLRLRRATPTPTPVLPRRPRSTSIPLERPLIATPQDMRSRRATSPRLLRRRSRSRLPHRSRIERPRPPHRPRFTLPPPPTSPSPLPPARRRIRLPLAVRRQRRKDSPLRRGRLGVPAGDDGVPFAAPAPRHRVHRHQRLLRLLLELRMRSGPAVPARRLGREPGSALSVAFAAPARRFSPPCASPRPSAPRAAGGPSARPSTCRPSRRAP